MANVGTTPTPIPFFNRIPTHCFDNSLFFQDNQRRVFKVVMAKTFYG